MPVGEAEHAEHERRDAHREEHGAGVRDRRPRPRNRRAPSSRGASGRGPSRRRRRPRRRAATERRCRCAGGRHPGRGGGPPMATSISSAIPRSTPQPIEPNSHSPRNSMPPIVSSSATMSSAPSASAPSATMRLTSPTISPSSVFARSTWARNSRLPASMVAPIWARTPGGSPGAGAAAGASAAAGAGLGAAGASRRGLAGRRRGWWAHRRPVVVHGSSGGLGTPVHGTSAVPYTRSARPVPSPRWNRSVPPSCCRSGRS